MTMKELFASLIAHQKSVLTSLAKRKIPLITSDDLLQPNDFPELEEDPRVRYEEGVLHGLQMAEAAWQAHKREKKEATPFP